jgi:hypothetical protein
MELELSSITIFEKGGDHELSDLVPLEKVLLHVRTSRDEVSRHDCSGAKAPQFYLAGLTRT